MAESAAADAEETRIVVDALKEECLELTPGEVVRVIAGGGGWLYGEVVGQPERCGYFPENRAISVDQSTNEEEVTMTKPGTLMKVNASFSPGFPGDNEEEVNFCDSCIALAEEDVVEVVAAGGGWLYGRVVGAPERVGYFPENRVSWVGKPVEKGCTQDQVDHHGGFEASSASSTLRAAGAVDRNRSYSHHNPSTAAEEVAPIAHSEVQA
jgi:hypothetical protein